MAAKWNPSSTLLGVLIAVLGTLAGTAHAKLWQLSERVTRVETQYEAIITRLERMESKIDLIPKEEISASGRDSGPVLGGRGPGGEPAAASPGRAAVAERTP